jgi:prepilin-type N-terminal cleavage/methylation domain-containing protein
MNSNKNEKGFSLVELLVVVIIIAIVAAIAIPNLLASRRAANEASAISSLRTIHSAEATYQATTGNSVTYASGAGLTGLVDAVLAQDTFNKSGYTFTVTRGADPFTTYCAEAHPTDPGSSGVRSFAVGIDGVINFDPADAAACDPDTGVVTTGAPLGGS